MTDTPPLSHEAIAALAQGLAAADRTMRRDLVHLRRQVGLTHAAVAEILGVEPDDIAKLEAYYTDPTLSELRRYRAVLLMHAVVPEDATGERLPTVAEYVQQVITDPRYGNDLDWVKLNLNPVHLHALEAANRE